MEPAAGSIRGIAAEQSAVPGGADAQSHTGRRSAACCDGLLNSASRSIRKDAGNVLNVSSVKQPADVLCYLGLISRWNLAEGAKLDARCTLFNDWCLAATDEC